MTSLLASFGAAAAARRGAPPWRGAVEVVGGGAMEVVGGGTEERIGGGAEEKVGGGHSSSVCVWTLSGSAAGAARGGSGGGCGWAAAQTEAGAVSSSKLRTGFEHGQSVAGCGDDGHSGGCDSGGGHVPMMTSLALLAALVAKCEALKVW